MTQGRGNAIQPNHIGTFLLLLTLAVIRPEGIFPGIGLPVGPLCLLAALFVLPWKIQSTLGFPEFWRQYRLPLLLIVSYQVLCTISLLYNMDRYATPTDFFRWGVVFIAGQMLLPLCIFIFLAPENTPTLARSETAIVRALAALITILIPASVLLQVYFPDLGALIIKYSVGGDISSIRTPIRGVLATATDLGAISGVFCWAAIALAAQNAKNEHKFAVVSTLFAVLFAFAGVLSGSRNFLLFLAVAIVTVLIVKFWARNKMLLVAALLSLLGLFHASAYTFPHFLLRKLAIFLPYFEKVRTRTEISLTDLAPNISRETLGPRATLWESATKYIADNPVIGVSNGGFRLADDCSCFEGNTHNILLQSAIDAGILGVVIIGLLLVYLVKRTAHNKWSLALILGIISTLMVDNFTDHSYAWIVVVSYFGVLLARPRQHSSI